MTKEKIKSSFSILFVDDEENARKYFDKGLRNDFAILTAGSVDEAQKIITENHQNIAVVVTDQRMPGGNGVKLLRFLRENYPHIVRLLTTAYSDLTEAIEAVNSGEIFRYIQKPWDYNLLKTEMHQAVELFELRLERNQMLHEKIMVKRKMTRIERTKSLLLLARNLKFLNFADISTQNFIKTFATNVEESEDQDWESFDFGKQEVLETRYFFDVIDRVQAAISSSGNYAIENEINSAQINSLIEEVKKNLGLDLEVKVVAEIKSKINSQSFAVLIKSLLEISASAKSTNPLTIEKIENGISINLKIPQISTSENSNFFTICPDKNSPDFYINLLLCYLVAGHHGGKIEISENFDSLACAVKLPSNPQESNFISQIELDSMENAILTVMLC